MCGKPCFIHSYTETKPNRPLVQLFTVFAVIIKAMWALESLQDITRTYLSTSPCLPTHFLLRPLCYPFFYQLILCWLSPCMLHSAKVKKWSHLPSETLVHRGPSPSNSPLEGQGLHLLLSKSNFLYESNTDYQDICYYNGLCKLNKECLFLLSQPIVISHSSRDWIES